MSKKPKTAKAVSTETDKTPIPTIPAKPATKRVLAKDSRQQSPQQKGKGPDRENSKKFLLLEMLHRSEGATIAQLTESTGWQQHSVRGFLSGTVKKKLGLKILTDKTKDGIRTYRIKAA